MSVTRPRRRSSPSMSLVAPPTRGPMEIGRPSPRVNASPRPPSAVTRLRGHTTGPWAPSTARIFSVRSDASPFAPVFSPAKRSPREQSWPPREMHHHFGHHDPYALAPHAFVAARHSVSPPPTPTRSDTSKGFTKANDRGDVHGRLVALERIRASANTRQPQTLVAPTMLERDVRDEQIGLFPRFRSVGGQCTQSQVLGLRSKIFSGFYDGLLSET